jgi:hypothetical protein
MYSAPEDSCTEYDKGIKLLRGYQRLGKLARCFSDNQNLPKANSFTEPSSISTSNLEIYYSSILSTPLLYQTFFPLLPFSTPLAIFATPFSIPFVTLIKPSPPEVVPVVLFTVFPKPRPTAPTTPPTVLVTPPTALPTCFSWRQSIG